VYVICACLVFLSVGDLLVNCDLRSLSLYYYAAGGIVTAQSTAENPLKMVEKKDRNM
jgi:hypothetical protein